MSNITFTNLPVALTLTGSEILAAVQNGTSVRFTTAQLGALVGAVAAGSNTQVQYNSSGKFAASPSFTFDGFKLTVPVLYASNGIYGGSF